MYNITTSLLTISNLQYISGTVHGRKNTGACYCADEPTGNLDEHTANEIISIFQKLAHEQEKCVIVVTHSRELAEQADIVLRLKKGKIADDTDIGEN